MKEPPFSPCLSQYLILHNASIVTLAWHYVIGVKIYRRFYTEEMEQANGVLAISVSKLSFQPCTSLASLFSVGSLFYETIITDYLLDLKIDFDLLIFVSSSLLILICISHAEKKVVSLIVRHSCFAKEE